MGRLLNRQRGPSDGGDDATVADGVRDAHAGRVAGLIELGCGLMNPATTRGVVLLAVGLVVVGLPDVSVAALDLAFGVLLVLVGVADIALALSGRGRRLARDRWRAGLRGPFACWWVRASSWTRPMPWPWWSSWSASSWCCQACSPWCSALSAAGIR